MAIRQLTASEKCVLLLVQELYGEHNDEEKVFLVDDSEACIAIEDSDGNTVMMASLTNLAAWREDGSIVSDEELKTKWLSI